MLDTFKAQCFRNAQNVSDAQLAAFVSIAHEMKVNPLLPGMLYAYPTGQGGIVPMMGPDGVFKKLSEHPGVDSWEVQLYPEDVTQPATHAVARIFRKGVERPLTYTALLSEWKVQANPNWSSRPRHMLSIRALKQCARQIIHGIPFDEDERVIAEAINVTGTAADTPPDRPAPPRRAAKGAAAVVQNAPKAVAPEVVVPAEPAKEPEAATPAPVESFAQAAEATQAEPVAEAPKPRAFLNDGELLECEVKVIECAGGSLTSNGTKYPSVRAKVTGGYNGDIYHINGGKTEGDKTVPLPPWKAGASLAVKLKGIKNESGAVKAYVESVEVAPEVF